MFKGRLDRKSKSPLNIISIFTLYLKTSQSICLHDASLSKFQIKKERKTQSSQAAGDLNSVATKKNDNKPKTLPVRHECTAYLFPRNYCFITKAMPCICSVMRIEKYEPVL